MIKYIKGSWFEFQHYNTPEGVYWNPACASFNDADWDTKLKEISELGIEYLVLMIVGVDFKTYYDSNYYGKIILGCEDPIEAVLTSADKYGIKFFIGGGIFGEWKDVFKKMLFPEIARLYQEGINEVAKKYANHKSFYGWYWPDEPYIDKNFSEDYINYVNICSKEARKLTPNGKILIAPYGTRVVVADEKYAKQLDILDVDIIAYQDEIGVRKTKVEESGGFFKNLRKVHDLVPRVALWADVEIFECEGEVGISPLIPADFNRIIKQFEVISPYVDEILIYQYQGMMNKPNTKAFAGHPNSTRLYKYYLEWMIKNYPEKLKGY
ncbi:MAG TPA: DUF4434 domain-containing protein [Clostridiaceae bacterium]